MKLYYENLLGRPWEMNKDDCFSIGREFFKENFDIDIPDVARPQLWDADILDLIKTHYTHLGFELHGVEEWNELRPADVLAMAIASSNANHLAIYVGDNEIIHHKAGTLSCKELLRPFWRMSTLYILRHPDVPDLRPELPDIPLEELIRGRFTGQTAKILSSRK